MWCRFVVASVPVCSEGVGIYFALKLVKGVVEVFYMCLDSFCFFMCSEKVSEFDDPIYYQEKMPNDIPLYP